jgi:hypothetical protein
MKCCGLFQQAALSRRRQILITRTCLLAPGVGYADGFYGWHSGMRLSAGPYLHYGVVDKYNLDQGMQTYSHELVETMGDPRLNGYYGDDDGNCGQQPCEDGDACYCFTRILGDIAVTYYHGGIDASCVAPNATGGCQVGGTPHCKTCQDLGAKCGQVDDGWETFGNAALARYPTPAGAAGCPTYAAAYLQKVTHVSSPQ